MVQAEFATAMLKACQQAGIHTCLETTLHAPWAALESALVWTDLLICDLKCADAEKHARATGVRNDTVLENLARASRATDQIIVRIPVIPGFNDDMDDLDAAASLLEEKMDVRPIEVQLLEFMHRG